VNELLPTSQKSYCPFFLILYLVVLGQVGFDIYLPSLPAMAADLNTTISLVQFSLSVYLVSMAFSQLFYGPLSDTYGRRNIILYAVSLYLLSSFACTVASTVQYLLIFRFIQGFSAGACVVIARAITRDQYHGKNLAKATVFLSIAWAIVPMLAPVAGGFIQQYIGWRYNFLLLLAISIVCFTLLFFFLPETLKQKKTPSVKHIFSSYKQLLSSRFFVGNLLPPALLYSSSVAYVSVAPILFQSRLHVTASHSGLLLMTTTIFYLIGSIVNRFSLNKFSMRSIILAGILLAVLSATSLIVLAFFANLTIAVIIIPFIFYYFSAGLIFATCVTKALIPFPSIAGTASALLGCLQVLMGAISTAIMSHLPDASLRPLAFYVLMAMVISLISILCITPTDNPHR